MVRMRAPRGVHSFSHEGKHHDVGEDGHVEVDSHVADALSSHGFAPASAPHPVTEDIVIKRGTIMSMLDALGVAISGEFLSAEHLVEALVAGIMAKIVGHAHVDPVVPVEPDPVTKADVAKTVEKSAKEKKHHHGEAHRGEGG